jgi:hypothetical protein
MSTNHADLSCETCGQVTDHELRYAGRLLEWTRCTVCGTQVEVRPRALMPAYARDLEHRLASKPRRMWRRWRRDPVGYTVGLPAAIARQPVKLARELWGLVRR